MIDKETASSRSLSDVEIKYRSNTKEIAKAYHDRIQCSKSANLKMQWCLHIFVVISGDGANGCRLDEHATNHEGCIGCTTLLSESARLTKHSCGPSL